MAFIENYGFKIYRLKMAQDNCEFLIFDEDSKKYYQYSMTRGKSMLRLMIEKILGKSLIQHYLDVGLLEVADKKKETVVNASFNDNVTNEIELIDNINYDPTESKIYQDQEEVYFNIYNKSKILSKDLTEIKSEFPTIKKIILNLVGDDEEAFIYFCKWLAWQLQNPHQRLATSIIFKGEHGTGKTLLCNYVLRPIFESNYTEVGQSDINKDYNDYIMGKQLIVANEVIHNDNKNVVAEKLKNYVTDDYVSIQRKYKDSINVKNYAHWIFISNNQIPIKLGRNDRRYSVFASKTLKDGFELFMNLKSNQEKEVLGFVKYLMSLDVNMEEINYPYQNETRKDLIEASLNSVELFIETIFDVGGIDKLNEEYQSNKNESWYNYLTYISKPVGTYIKLDGFYNLYLKFCSHAGYKNKYGRNGFTSILKHLNFKLSVIKDEEGKSARCLLLTGALEK